jgi:hypothetical protein
MAAYRDIVKVWPGNCFSPVAAQVCTGGIDWDGWVLLSKKKSLCSHILSMKSTFHICFFLSTLFPSGVPALVGTSSDEFCTSRQAAWWKTFLEPSISGPLLLRRFAHDGLPNQARKKMTRKPPNCLTETQLSMANCVQIERGFYGHKRTVFFENSLNIGVHLCASSKPQRSSQNGEKRHNQRLRAWIKTAETN